MTNGYQFGYSLLLLKLSSALHDLRCLGVVRQFSLRKVINYICVAKAYKEATDSIRIKADYLDLCVFDLDFMWVNDEVFRFSSLD